MYLDFCSFTDFRAQMDGTMVCGNDASDDGEAKSCAIFLISYKRTENGLLMFCRNPAAVVFDGNHQPFVVSEYLQCNASPSGDGLNGIFNQVNESLLQPDRIAVEIGISVIQLNKERDVLVQQIRKERVFQVTGKILWVDFTDA